MERLTSRQIIAEYEKQASLWLKNQLDEVDWDKVPVQPGNAGKGIRLSPSPTAYFERVLYPDGSIGVYYHGGWDLYKIIDPDFLRRPGLFDEIEEKISPYRREEPQKSQRFGWFKR